MTYDLIVVGGGPGGLTAGIYARSKMMKTLVIDANKVGGQLVSLYPEKGVHNYPGFESIQARKLSDKLYAQAESMDCEIHEREMVLEINDGDGKLIVKTDKAEYESLSVIVAIGMGMFKPKKMGAQNEELFYKKGLDYVLPSKEDLVGKKVVMFGGGNSAIDMAMVSSTVADTTLVHRRDTFRADEMTLTGLERSRVKKIMSTNLVSVNGKDVVESVTLSQGDKTFEERADLVIINIGISSDLECLKKWGLELTESGLVKVNYDMSTNRHGIYACGDVIDYEGKYKQIITACGEAATAVLSAYKFAKKPYWA